MKRHPSFLHEIEVLREAVLWTVVFRAPAGSSSTFERFEFASLSSAIDFASSAVKRLSRPMIYGVNAAGRSALVTSDLLAQMSRPT